MTEAELNGWATHYIEARLAPNMNRVAHDDPRWVAVERAMVPTNKEAVEDIWLLVLEVLSRDPPDNVIAVLAAGPLEELIAYAGDRFIDRIELHARRDRKFRHLLGGVWQHRTPEAIWNRVERARGTTW